MQIENMDTITAEKLKAEKDPMELACNPLSKLEFIADAIKGLCEYPEVFKELDNPRAMGEIIADATMELWAITNAGMNRIDALEAQLKAYQTVPTTSPVEDDQQPEHRMGFVVLKGGAE